MDRQLSVARAVLDAPSSRATPIVDALFRREVAVPIDVVRRSLGQAGSDALVAVGLARASDEALVSTARVSRFGGQLIASDRIGFRRHADFVLGPGPATATLASAVRPGPPGRVLDLGCGPGSLGLWLAAGGAAVVGVDVSHRALAFASFNRRLNDVAAASFRHGDFLTAPPDESLDEGFDLAVANPPFVLSPRAELTYRDGPLDGDATTRVAIERVRRALAPGGRGYVIGSWADDAVGGWEARPKAWLRGLDGRAVITRISSVAPGPYVRSWTNDLDVRDRAAAADVWVRWLESEGIRRITTGVIAVARSRDRWSVRRVVRAIDGSRPGWRAIEAMLA